MHCMIKFLFTMKTDAQSSDDEIEMVLAEVVKSRQPSTITQLSHCTQPLPLSLSSPVQSQTD